jgi:hypothetical protein
MTPAAAAAARPMLNSRKRRRSIDNPPIDPSLAGSSRRNAHRLHYHADYNAVAQLYRLAISSE